MQREINLLSIKQVLILFKDVLILTILITFITACQINQKLRSYQMLNVTTEGFSNISCSEPPKRTLYFLVIDKRELFDKRLIGQIYMPINLPNIVTTRPSEHFIFLKNNESLVVVIQHLVEKALISSCYKPILIKDNSSVSLNSDENLVLLIEIRKFWLTPDWKTTHSIVLNLILFDVKTNKLIKEKIIKAEYGKVIGICNTKDFEELININMEEIYCKLIEYFVSEEFLR